MLKYKEKGDKMQIQNRRPFFPGFLCFSCWFTASLRLKIPRISAILSIMARQSIIRIINIAFKTILAFFVVSGLVVLLAISKTPRDSLNLLAYFTIQSNLILLFVVMAGAIRQIRNRPEPPLLRMIRNGSTLWILITGTVYHLLLSKSLTAGGPFLYALVAHHYVTPIMALLNWVLFEEKGKCRYRDAAYWLLYPLLYTVFSEVRALVDGFYPYWFLNPNAPFPKGTGSLAGLALAFAALLAFFVLSGLVIVTADRVLGGTWGKRADAGKPPH
jgi:hypothetical protein